MALFDFKERRKELARLGLRCPFGHDKDFRRQEGLDTEPETEEERKERLNSAQKAQLFEDYVQSSIQEYAKEGIKFEPLRVSPLQYIVMIWAEDAQGSIGTSAGIPWDVPADREHFKACTMGHALIMGRKTFEQLQKPLEGRRNIVISQDPEFKAEGCEIVHSAQEALDLLAHEREIWVIGGKQIYDQFIHVAKELVVSYLMLDSSELAAQAERIDAPYILPHEWAIEEEKSDKNWREKSGDAQWRIVSYRRVQSSWIYTNPGLYR